MTAKYVAEFWMEEPENIKELYFSHAGVKGGEKLYQ